MQQYLRTEREIALWIESLIKERHPGWIRTLGEHNNWASRIYAFLFINFNGYTNVRKRHHIMLGGNGFRKGHEKTYLSAIECELKKWGKVIASKRFPVNIKIN